MTTIRVPVDVREKVKNLAAELSENYPRGVKWTQAAVIESLVVRYGRALVEGLEPKED